MEEELTRNLLKRDDGPNLFSFLTVNEYVGKDSLGDTGVVPPASCLIPRLASMPQTCSQPQSILDYPTNSLAEEAWG